MSDITRRLRAIARTDSTSEPKTTPTLVAINAPAPADELPEPSTEPDAAPPPADETPPELPSLPVSFPGYELLGEIGRGGMGVVYRARHHSLNRLVALKVILAGPHASAADKARFRLEAEAGARLRHPNIVHVYDVGEHAGFAYIAFELVEGATLRTWQDGKAVDPREAARLIADVARAVHHAHEHGIIHRDIKPANILLTSADSGARSGELRAADPTPGSASHSALRAPRPTLLPKITDFGLAKALDSGADLTTTGMACGTPNYMAPEQVRGVRQVGPAADVYGVGAVLYELLTGKPPFTGWNGAQVMQKILHLEPEPARRLRPDLPRDLGVIVAKCLEKDPARRYASAADLADDLDRFLAGRPIQARAVGPAERAWRWAKRNPVIAGFLLVSTVGCSITSGLALALNRSAAVERAARQAAEREQARADTERAEAERVRDELRVAVGKVETERQTAEREKVAADAARTAADLDRAAATREASRSEKSLRLARTALRTVFQEFGQHPEFQGPAFRDLRVRLLTAVGDLRRRLEPLASNDPDALSDLAESAHWMGFLHYLNGNMLDAAGDYMAAAATCCRWADADPDDLEARARMADALLNAGRAYYHAGRRDEAEARYRDTLGLLEAVVDRHPQREQTAAELVRAFGPLYELLREQKRWADGAELCSEYLRRAQALVHRPGPKIEYVFLLANAHQCLGQMLDRTGSFDAAECHLLEAAALRDRIGDGTQWPTDRAAEAARTRFALAQHYLFTDRPAPAKAELARGVGLLEGVVQAGAATAETEMDLVNWTGLLAELHRKANELSAAEPRYDAVLTRLDEMLRRPTPPSAARQAWAAAVAGRADLYNRTGRHREAAAEWARVAKADPDERMRPNHELFVLQSLVYAGDRQAAGRGADRLAEGTPPPALLVDLARVWCRIAKAAGEDPALSPGDRAQEADRAIDKAVRYLERARAAGVFKNPAALRFFNTERDYDAVRGKFKPTE